MNSGKASLESMQERNLRLLPQRLGHTEDTLRVVRQKVSQQRDDHSTTLSLIHHTDVADAPYVATLFVHLTIFHTQRLSMVSLHHLLQMIMGSMLVT